MRTDYYIFEDLIICEDDNHKRANIRKIFKESPCTIAFQSLYPPNESNTYYSFLVDLKELIDRLGWMKGEMFKQEEELAKKLRE